MEEVKREERSKEERGKNEAPQKVGIIYDLGIRKIL